MEEPSLFPQHEMLDKKLVWEKLHARLDGKRKNRKMLWYWLAAASLLFVIIYPLSRVKKESIKENRETTRTQQEKISSPSNRSAAELINPPKPEIESGLTIVNTGSKLVIKTVPVKAGYVKVLPVKEMDHDSNSVKDNFNNSIMLATANPPMDTIARFVANSSVPITKKKLRVVHINEIDEVSTGYAASKPEPNTTAFSVSLGKANQPNKLGSPNIVSLRFFSK